MKVACTLPDETTVAYSLPVGFPTMDEANVQTVGEVPAVIEPALPDGFDVPPTHRRFAPVVVIAVPLVTAFAVVPGPF